MIRLALTLCLLACSVALRAQSAADVSPFIGGVWAGNVTATSATVSIRLNAPGLRVRLQVSQAESLTPATFSSAVTTAAASGNTVKLTVQGLVPDTDYFYGIEVGGVLRRETASRGRFTTFPLGKASFKIAFSSCGDFRASDQRAFPAI
ncbi:MAG: PhoD-like phosphatase N-terminal domain-containing protein, partial [Opitutaceae bacterium]